MKRPFDDPFSALDAALRKYPRGGVAQAVIVDIHAEATSEKMAMGHFCDGRASLVVGTHTHVPTADAMILPQRHRIPDRRGHVRRLQLRHRDAEGRTDAPVHHRHAEGALHPRQRGGDLSGVMVETDDRTGAATKITPVRVGGRLQDAGP
jgi:calcineurin-like phosphoesterase